MAVWMKPCECGQMIRGKATRCRACYREWIKGRAPNSFARRPDLLAMVNARRVPCPTCGTSLTRAIYERHVRNHDLFNRIDASGDCWLWTGSIGRFGYGIVRQAGGAGRMAHRSVWEELVGPIPSGYQLDHLCRVRHCVNPDHLEVVTPVENRSRGYAPSIRRYRVRHGISQFGRYAA